jgi:hypothetical protein
MLTSKQLPFSAGHWKQIAGRGLAPSSIWWGAAFASNIVREYRANGILSTKQDRYIGFRCARCDNVIFYAGISLCAIINRGTTTVSQEGRLGSGDLPSACR